MWKTDKRTNEHIPAITQSEPSKRLKLHKATYQNSEQYNLHVHMYVHCVHTFILYLDAFIFGAYNQKSSIFSAQIGYSLVFRYTSKL